MNDDGSPPLDGEVVEGKSEPFCATPKNFVGVPADLPKQHAGMPLEDIRDPLQVRLIGTADLSQALGVSTQSIWRWTKSGYLPAPRYFGRNPYWHLASVQKFLAKGAA